MRKSNIIEIGSRLRAFREAIENVDPKRLESDYLYAKELNFCMRQLDKVYPELCKAPILSSADLLEVLTIISDALTEDEMAHKAYVTILSKNAQQYVFRLQRVARKEAHEASL
jgi:hypothetical protein